MEATYSELNLELSIGIATTKAILTGSAEVFVPTIYLENPSFVASLLGKNGIKVYKTREVKGGAIVQLIYEDSIQKSIKQVQELVKNE